MPISDRVAEVAFGDRNELGKAIASRAIEASVEGFYQEADKVVDKWIKVTATPSVDDVIKILDAIAVKAAKLLDDAFRSLANMR